MTLLKAAVEGSGHALHEASNVENLAQLAETHSPSMVILCEAEHQEAGGVEKIQSALGNHATLTRVLAAEA
jgi:hypothetical protein